MRIFLSFITFFISIQSSFAQSKNEIREAIEKAEIALIDNIDSDNEIIFAKILSNNYAVKMNPKLLEYLNYKYSAIKYSKQFNNLFFINNKEYDYYKDSSKLSKIDKLTAQVLCCNKLNLNKDEIEKTINKFYLKYGYSQTHAVLAVKILDEKKCFDNNFIKAQSVTGYNILNNIINKDSVFHDLKYEAIAFKSVIFNKKASKDILKSILNLQRKNGGWSSHEKGIKPSVHTTLLVLMILYDLDRKNNIPFLFLKYNE